MAKAEELRERLMQPPDRSGALSIATLKALSGIIWPSSPMSLSPGSRLGSYEVTALIGQGGMGEVWQATDTQLGRDVAPQILPDAFADDRIAWLASSERRRCLASLNHPNLAAVHGIDETGT